MISAQLNVTCGGNSAMYTTGGDLLDADRWTLLDVFEDKLDPLMFGLPSTPKGTSIIIQVILSHSTYKVKEEASLTLTQDVEGDILKVIIGLCEEGMDTSELSNRLSRYVTELAVDRFIAAYEKAKSKAKPKVDKKKAKSKAKPKVDKKKATKASRKELKKDEK